LLLVPAPSLIYLSPVKPLRSAVDRQSSGYQTNYAAMQSAVARLHAELKRSTEGGGEKYVKRHLERGKLLPRDRVEMLLDEGSYFLEIAPLAGHGVWLSRGEYRLRSGDGDGDSAAIGFRESCV
jgi:acetyl-CoA carboxylase carboxyltransferase component